MLFGRPVVEVVVNDVGLTATAADVGDWADDDGPLWNVVGAVANGWVPLDVPNVVGVGLMTVG